MSPPRFELPGKARFRTEYFEGGERIVIGSGRNWFVMPFIAVWLVFWTSAGIGAVHTLVSAPEKAFMSLWLVLWAFGWTGAVTWLLWQIGGKTLLWVEQGALVYRWQMPLVGRTKHYDVRQIANLHPSEASGSFFTGRLGGGMMRGSYPPFYPVQEGAIRFDYGQRTVRLVPGLDEAEGQLVVNWLAARLPRSAVG